MASNENQNQNQRAGLVGAHAEYAKGATEAAIGAVTGSQAWTASGEQAKAHAVSDMKAASGGRDAGTRGYGKAEEVAGRAVGCEGMVEEGAASARKEE